MFEIKGLSVNYGGIEAVRDISFSVEEGSIVTLIGANGAGKSTTLRTIAGLVKPRSGKITFMGEDITGKDPAFIVGKGITLVPEGRRIFPDLTVYENLRIGAYLRKDRIDDDIEWVFSLFPRLRERSWQYGGTLSGGERGRVHLAKTLLAGGNVLLLDEPSNDLDVETLRALEDALLEFAGCAMVTSHDRWFLDRIATHILAFEGDSKVVFFDGNYTEYEADKRKRLGEEAARPHRLRFKPLKH